MISYIDAGGASQKAGGQTKERNGDDDDDDDDDSQVAPAAWGPHSNLVIYKNSILWSNLRAFILKKTFIERLMFVLMH